MSHLIAAPIVAYIGALLVSSFDPPPIARAVQPRVHLAKRVDAPIRDHDARRRKVLIVAVGQSNNGVTFEPGALDPVLDAPDARILELSRGHFRSNFVVAVPGERHVFQHPAQDDRGGICMRLAGAKALLQRFPAIEEITLYCGAVGGTSLAPGGGEWAVDGALTQATIQWCGAFMAAHPDHEVIFWCSLGTSDAILGMPQHVFRRRLAALAETLRAGIPGAADAFWVQGDMPRPLVDWIDGVAGNGTDILEAQNGVAGYIPNAGAASMFDLSTYENVHLDMEGLRLFGVRMARASRL
ncbi:MAG: sialate O-acetylesterase [Planctomycetota bacterium]|nr:sialate O-acetylesterase [Planctomycetota bacterium]